MRFPKPGALALALPLAALLAAALARADDPAAPAGVPPAASSSTDAPAPAPAPASTTATAAPAPAGTATASPAPATASAAAAPIAPVPRPPSTRTAKGTLTILHTNDWHGYALAQTPKRPPKNKPAVPSGGFVAAAAYMAKVRAEVGADHVLALDAGDLLTGFPAAGMTEDGVVGATFMRAFGGVGYDAWVIGNHDFDAGRKNAEAIVKLVPAPCLCANLVRADDGAPALAGVLPYKVFDRGGLKVAVIGCTAPDLARLSSAQTMAGWRALSLVEAMRPHVEKLRAECDLVVALTHAGLDNDKLLARTLLSIDVVVGGHSHTRLAAPVVESGCVIVQAGCNGREVGRLDLVVEGGRVASHKGFLIAPEATGASPTAAMAEPIAKMEKYIGELEADVLGETTVALQRGSYHMETPIGSFIADSIKLATGADVGLINSGGVRADFDKGPVTRAELLRCLPNDDKLATFEVSGADLEKICLHNARAAVTQDHGILQVGGLRYRFQKTEGEKPDAKILKVEVNGKPLDPSRTYLCASTVFIASEQAPKYLSVEPLNRKILDKGTHAALVEAFKRGPIEAPDRFRIFEERDGARKPKPKKPKEPVEPREPEGEPKEAPKEPAPAGAGGEGE